jgi:glutamyl-Q tRNA(Asp) synthetase
LASFLDARAARGLWRVRIEDLDTERMVPGADQLILQQLRALGMSWDGEVAYQSARLQNYQTAFDGLQTQNRLYPCGCTRREIADSVLSRHGGFPEGERPYRGTCREGLAQGKTATSWRVRVDDGDISFVDRWCGPQSQNVHQQVGDFVLRRADGHWAYQLAVVVDDAAQDITHVVRGQDLLSSTARQLWLARVLKLDSPRVMHVPLVTDDKGVKLSKQNGALAIDTEDPMPVLQAAWRHLGFFDVRASTPAQFYEQAVKQWAGRFKPN